MVSASSSKRSPLLLGPSPRASWQNCSASGRSAAGTFDASRAGQRVFVRTIPHGAGEHPELDESAVDRFVVEFLSSGADRGLLITEKFSPFEIYERERREPRMRFITRERFQAFIDALAVG